MATRSHRTPSYRLHKPSGQPVVTLGGRDVYLGPFASSASRAEYDRLIAEWLSNGRAPARPASPEGPDLTVNELLLAFVRWAETYYRKGGRVTGEVTNIRYALRSLRELYGHTPAKDFGPLQLKTVRQAVIETGICRNEVNRRIRIVTRAFKWAVSEGMVPPSTHHGLQAVSGLRKGRCEARESAAVRPVPEAFVEAIRPYVNRCVWAMVELQRLTGMRPGEVCTMRTGDIDTSGRLWVYTPGSHKTEHHGRERRIYHRSPGPRGPTPLAPPRPGGLPLLTRRGRGGEEGAPTSESEVAGPAIPGVETKGTTQEGPGRALYSRFSPSGDYQRL